MAAVESELWNIFTFYTLHGNPLDPEHMTSQQFVKMAKDCSIVDVAADGTTLVASPQRQRAEPGQPQPAQQLQVCLLYTSPSPRDATLSRMPSSA